METKNAKFCMHCGAELPQGAAFCPSCGKRIAETMGDLSESVEIQTKNDEVAMTMEKQGGNVAVHESSSSQRLIQDAGWASEVPFGSDQSEVREQSTDAKIGNKDDAQYREDGFMFAKICAVALFSVVCFFAFFAILKLWTSVDWERQEGQLTHNLIVTVFLLLPVSLGFSIIHRKYFKKGK